MQQGFQTLDPHLWAYIATFTSDFKDVVTIRSLCRNARKATRIRRLPDWKYITDRDIREIPALVGLVELDASYNSAITDVSSLVNLTTLYASHNSGIADVSALVNLTTLDARGESGITDVSTLVNLTTLYAYGNNRIRGIRPGTKVYR